MNDTARRADAAPRAASVPADPSRAGWVPTALLAWLVPGAGHALQGQPAKAAVLALVLFGMYVIGLTFGGRLFPFQVSDILVFLAALAEWSAGLPRLAAAMIGAGAGRVTAVTYEYGNAFLIAAGLLNIVVVLDAIDLATGRKPR